MLGATVREVCSFMLFSIWVISTVRALRFSGYSDRGRLPQFHLWLYSLSRAGSLSCASRWLLVLGPAVTGVKARGHRA